MRGWRAGVAVCVARCVSLLRATLTRSWSCACLMHRNGGRWTAALHSHPNHPKNSPSPIILTLRLRTLLVSREALSASKRCVHLSCRSLTSPKREQSIESWTRLTRARPECTVYDAALQARHALREALLPSSNDGRPVRTPVVASRAGKDKLTWIARAGTEEVNSYEPLCFFSSLISPMLTPPDRAAPPLSSRRAQGGSSAASPGGSCASWCVCALSPSRLCARAMPGCALDRRRGQIRTALRTRASLAARGAGGARGLCTAVDDVARCRVAPCHERAGCFSRTGAAIIARQALQ